MIVSKAALAAGQEWVVWHFPKRKEQAPGALGIYWGPQTPGILRPGPARGPPFPYPPADLSNTAQHGHGRTSMWQDRVGASPFTCYGSAARVSKTGLRDQSSLRAPM
jgi:hypothetical protein